MRDSVPFLYFLSLLLFKQRSKHTATVIISIILIALLSSVLFLSAALQHELKESVSHQADFTVSKEQAGEAVNTPIEWIEAISEIEGVSRVSPRIYGRYFFTPRGKSFMVIGVDFFDEQSSQMLQTLMKGIDLKAFFADESMIVGEGVKRFLSKHYYTDYFSFKTPKGTFKKVKIFQTFPKTTALFTDDMMLMPIQTAREVFGMREDEVSDITFNVLNDAEWDNIITKIHLLFYDVRVVEKREVLKAYQNLYNYKGGFFLILYVVVLATFMMLLYGRYTLVYSTERKEIGILRAVGWSIKEVLMLKFYETLSVVLVSFAAGVLLAYFYVFALNAPILSQIFLGGANLPVMVQFTPTVEIGLLGLLFLLYTVPFFVAVLIPAWRVAVTSPREAMA